MNEKIKQLENTTFNGRRFTRQQLSDMQRTVESFPNLSRKELAITICEHLEWRTPGGKYSYQACLLVLQRLEALGVMKLPPKDASKLSRGARKPLQWSEDSAPQPELAAKLKDLSPLRLEVVKSGDEFRLWKELVDRHHYLGYKHPIGANLRYFVVDRNDRKLACIGFCFAVRELPCRDKWIGWQEQKHKKHLRLVVNQNRFLILPWVKVKNLASKALSMCTRQLADDWQRQHGYRPVLIETFIDGNRFRGSSYRAANWKHLGITEKRSDKTQKEVYVYALEAQAKTILRQGPKDPRKKSTTPKVSSPQLHADDPFVHLWSQLGNTVSEVALEFDVKWRQRRNLIDTLLVMLFIFRLLFTKKRTGYANALAELWQQCRLLGIVLPQSEPVSAAAMGRARNKVNETVFKLLHQRVLVRYSTTEFELRWRGRRLYATDGSKLNLPGRLLRYGYRKPNEKASYSQGLVSCLYQLQTRIPIDFELVPHYDKGKTALTHLRVLQPTDVVAYDRGYYSYELLHEHRLRKVDAIFRMQQNSAEVIDQFMQGSKREAIVQMTPGTEVRRGIQARHANADCPPLSLRLVKFTVAGEEHTLATTLQNRQQFPSDSLSAVYHSRWGIEELRKNSEQMMADQQFHAQSERGVKQELYAHFVLITCSRFFSNHSEPHFQHQHVPAVPKLQVNFKRSNATL